jgi:Predicted exporters of the RND superfamily
LAIAALLTVASLHYAQQITMEEETEDYVDKNTRLYQEYDHLFMERFGTESIVVLVEGDDVTRPEVLEAMERLTHHMDDMRHVIDIQSIAHIVVEAEARETGISRVPNKKKIDEILAGVNPVIIGGILPDRRHTIIIIDMPYYISTVKMDELLIEAKSTVEMVDFPPDINVIVTGNIALGLEIIKEMSKGMNQLLAISVMLMVVALLLVFRHVKWPLLPLPIMLLGIIWTFGMAGFLHVPLTITSMAAFPILIGLGIDYAIQFHNRMEEELVRGESAAVAVIDTVTHTAPAVLIALTITCAGFASLFISSVPMIRDFGLLCVIGIVMCYLSALFVGVTILYQFERRRSASNKKVK